MNKSAQELLSELVKIPSVSNQDNSPVIELISSWFQEYEKNIQEWVRSDGVKGKNLIVKISGEDSSRSLVFVCHMDTVPESSDWETNPFELIQKEGKLYGLGSCDTKGGTAAVIQAVHNLSVKPACDIFLVFSGDEEVTSAGVLRLKQEIQFSNPQFIFIEPTDNKVLISQRSVLQINVVTHGMSQHGSYATPDENSINSAIFKMGEALQILVEDANQNAQKNDELLGTNTQNLGVIQGGTARNVMPDLCTLQIDRRLLPSVDVDNELERVKKLLLSNDPSVEVFKVIAHPSFSTSSDSLLVQNALKALDKVGIAGSIGGFQAWSEAGLFNNFKDVIILGPGSISQAHKANEFVLQKDLEDYMNVFSNIIESL